MSEILNVESCIAATKRTYPDGYGFALSYLDRAADHTKEIMDAANACVRYAFWKSPPEADSDIGKYAFAVMTIPYKTGGINPAVFWLIEAAQVLVQWGLDKTLPIDLQVKITNALRASGHPGY